MWAFDTDGSLRHYAITYVSFTPKKQELLSVWICIWLISKCTELLANFMSLTSDQLHLGLRLNKTHEMEWCEISQCAVLLTASRQLSCVRPKARISLFHFFSLFFLSAKCSWYFSNIAWQFYCSFQHNSSSQCFLCHDAMAATFCHSWLGLTNFLITISHCLGWCDFMGPLQFALFMIAMNLKSCRSLKYVRNKTCLSCNEQVDKLFFNDF